MRCSCTDGPHFLIFEGFQRCTTRATAHKFFCVLLPVRYVVDYFAALRLLLNLSTRPPASTNFCLPVKKGWHLEQISTFISFSPLGFVERVVTHSPQAHLIVTSSYLGWIPCFIGYTSLFCSLVYLRIIPHLSFIVKRRTESFAFILHIVHINSMISFRNFEIIRFSRREIYD